MPRYLHGVAIWAWHAPVLFDAAVNNVMLHRLQHLSFFLSAVLFWWSVLRRSERRRGGLACVHYHAAHQRARRADGAGAARSLWRANARPPWLGD